MCYHLILLLLLNNSLALAIMTGMTGMTAHALVPSQVPGARRHVVNAKKEDTTKALHYATHANNDKNGGDLEAGDQVVYTSLDISNELPSNPSNDNNDNASAASSSTSSSTTKNRKRISIPRTGNLPDIHWRAISMSHLRAHPNFQPLPPPSHISSLPTKEHVRNFRQDSWQWDYLHTGRCTTSQCAAALGFLEPRAARFLGIPSSLRRGGSGAWERLRQVVDDDVDVDLKGLEGVLCEGRTGCDTPSVLDDNNNNGNHGEKRGDTTVRRWRPTSKESERIWIPAHRLHNGLRTKPFPFTAKYIPNLTNDELYTRKLYLQRTHGTPSPMKTRMQWGNAQEATSVLTALNYFCDVDRRTTIHEVGMCGAGFDDGEDEVLQGVKIGASPDAIICHGNGTVEVLEVKNHCPFVWNRISPHYGNVKKSSNKKKKNKGKKKGKNKKKEVEDDEDDEQQKGGGHDGGPKHYLIRDFQLERRIPTAYIPQLMMEMLCVGDAVDLDNDNDDAHNSASRTPICTSAVMVRQTATKGAILLRLQRDEEWIQEMKYYLGRFQSEFVNTGKVPADNFFYDSDPNSRYHKFLQRTIELSESVEQVAFIDHSGVQRMVLERSRRTKGSSPLHHKVPLFLDRVNEGE
eukprot:CAMPEP_0201661460 /NCGR_PEP_ID=MMETSP0494-20130426/3824_1 /ASSEMBLY_ACC=CAM_ASM_000839 /TAXON_ID=420259 /ORGANISM="Thalassiosira gravida, Strain GMp14c1" /LENGTH=631 /DNA_ID=CAMNT_0048139581 /DNA_START=272 /DNA_END=2167 /DNA_ORIENTATION=+